MSHSHWLHPFLLISLLALLAPGHLKAGVCKTNSWSLKDMASSPVLVVGRVISIDVRAVSKSDHSRVARKTTAEIEVLRVALSPGTNSAAPMGRIKLHPIGSDAQAPDCPVPSLQPGQVLLLPLRANAKANVEPWQFIETAGFYLASPVTAEMAEPPLSGTGSRLFIVRELVNSFRQGSALDLFAVSLLLTSEGYYPEPDLPDQLAKQIPVDDARWARILSSLLLAFPGRPLTLASLQAGEPQQYRTQLQSSFHLAQLALGHLPGRAAAQAMVWQTLLADLPALTDSSAHGSALRLAARYLTLYQDDLVFIPALKAALNQDRPGSSAVALALVDKGQKDCLPEALTRASRVLRHPSADQLDLDAALLLVRRYGSGAERSELRATAMAFKKTIPLTQLT